VFDFFKRSSSKLATGGRRAAESSPDTSVPAHTQPNKSSYRELSSVVLRDTLRMNGIPTDWIGCESIPRTSDDSDGSLLIQLVINRWHPGLTVYAPLLQQQFQQGLQRFDPSSDHSGHVIVWKFSPDCGYPETAMPAADFWLTRPAVAAKPKFDLPPSDLDHLDDDFAATVAGEFPPTVPGNFR
jgi:hypothetical protein